MKTDHYKISPTAVLCTNGRAKYTDMPYSQEIAEEVKQLGLEGIVPNFLIKLLLKLPSAKEQISLLEGRYRSTNKALHEFGECSVLELASGLSSRGLEYACKTPVYIETDLPGIIEDKQRIVAAIRRDEGRQIEDNHYFMKLNVVNLENLMHAGQVIRARDSKSPIAVVFEGLFGYLDSEEQVTARDNMVEFLKEYSPNGAIITPDFSVRKVSHHPVVAVIRYLIRRKTGREFTYFKDDSDATAFANEGGLDVKITDNSDIARNLTCIDKLNLDVDRVLKMAHRYRPYVMTLRR